MKKLVCLALATMLLLALCFALASCGECKEHTWDAGTIVQPTCTENGKYVYTCTKCQATKDILPDPNMPEDAALMATGHKKDAGEVTTEPTCTETGVKTFGCVTCGAEAVETETVKAKGHKFSRQLSAADGKHFYACTVEGCDGKDSEEPCEYETVAVEGGEKHHELCQICDKVKENSEVAHTFGDEVTTNATCSAEGAVSKTCTACGYVSATVLPKLDHVYDETAYGSDDTHHWIPCTACGVAKADSEVEHTFGAEVTTQPTAGSCLPGKVAKTCTVCDKEVVVSYIASDTAHTFAFDAEASEMAAGGMEAGKLVYACTVCEFSYTVDAIGVMNYDDKAPIGTVWMSPANDLSISFENKNFALIGRVIAENNGAHTNAAISFGPARDGIALTDNKVLYLGFDISAPEAGYSETGWNLDIKFGNSWTNGQLKLICDGDGNLTFAGTSVGAATPGVMTNVIIQYVAEGTTISSCIWINGELKASAEATGVVASDFTDANSYINLTVNHSTEHVSTERGYILDNVFYASELPVFLADQAN